MKQMNLSGHGHSITAIAIIIVGPLLVLEAALDWPDSITQVAGTIVVALFASWTICTIRVGKTSQNKAVDSRSETDPSVS
jgi:hypothetical protein